MAKLAQNIDTDMAELAQNIDTDELEAAVAAAVTVSLARFRDQVKLNVGGVKLETTLSTLQRYNDSLLRTMFSGHEGIDIPTDADGYVFIDRDGTHFRAILNFLRIDRVAPRETHQAKVELLEEARFYLLEAGIVEALKAVDASTPHFTRKEIQARLFEQRASIREDGES
ncbi:BTB/POZ protein [Pavlovales sp. CCMP2436]|nr:BTB/POZ protein [Pavlovales sp. CCMP2436]